MEHGAWGKEEKGKIISDCGLWIADLKNIENSASLSFVVIGKRQNLIMFPSSDF